MDVAAGAAGVRRGGHVRGLHYVRLLLVQLRHSLLAAMQYRVGFWSDGVLGFLWSLAGVFPMVIAIGHRPDVAGWSPLQLVVLVGCYAVVQGIFGAFLQPALVESMEHVRRGTLDYVLLRPADALFLCLTAAFSPWRLVEVAGGCVLIAGGLWQLGHVPTPLQLLMAGVAMGLGLVILYSLGVVMLSIGFWALKLENLTFFLESVLDFGRWPGAVFRGPVKAFFTFVIPLILMTTFPARALLGMLDGPALAMAAAVASALAVVARLAWGRALRGYTSASS